MRPRRIPDEDSLFRHSIYPVSFKRDVFAVGKLWNLVVQSDGSLLGSLVWQRYAPREKHIHRHGCRLALRRNEGKRHEGTFKETNRQVYCGAYRISARSVRSLASDQLSGVLSAEVIHHIEDGEIAHSDLRVRLNQVPFDTEGTKTAILDRLWNACSGPMKHVCDSDWDISSHPNLHLAVPPLGPYRDSRFLFSRLWSLFRFSICNWMWLHCKM
jgi:hypothetical protein